MSDPCKKRFMTWIPQKSGGSMLGEVVVAEEYDAALITTADTAPGSTIRVMRGPCGGLYLSGIEDLQEGDVFHREARK